MKIKSKHPLFDTLIQENPTMRNDADLCRALDIEAPMISKMRNRKAPVSDKVRVAIMRRFRWPLKRLDEMAPPEELQAG